MLKIYRLLLDEKFSNLDVDKVRDTIILTLSLRPWETDYIDAREDKHQSKNITLKDTSNCYRWQRKADPFMVIVLLCCLASFVRVFYA